MPSLKHLDFLQSAIGRMGRNSFQMKSWNVALASAVIGSLRQRIRIHGGPLLHLCPTVSNKSIRVNDAFWLAPAPTN